MDAFFSFYMDTGARKWGRPYLNRRFFSLIGKQIANHILLVMARRGRRHIAGALNFIGSDALYGRYWGAVEEQPFLHFELCYYQAIEWAIAHGLPRVEAGAPGGAQACSRVSADHDVLCSLDRRSRLPPRRRRLCRARDAGRSPTIARRWRNSCRSEQK